MKPLDCLVPFAVIVVLTGCATSGDQLRTRAGFDLGCPREQVMLTPLDGNGGEPTSGPIADSETTVGVSGCGRKATYVKVKGTWVKNAETTR